MAPSPFAPTVHAPIDTASGASVLPGVPLPEWAGPPAAVVPPVVETTEPAVEADPALVPAYAVAEAAYSSAPEPVAAPALAEPAEPAGAWSATEPSIAAYYPSAPLPDLGDAAWDAPPPEPAPAGHRHFPAAAEPEAEPRSSRRLLLVLLGAVALVAVGAFTAFVTPGWMTSSAEEPTGVVAPVAPPAAAPAAPSDPTQAFYAAWEESAGVTKASKVEGMPAGTSARCGSATVSGASGTTCAFTGKGVQGVLWYPGTAVKAAGERTAAAAAKAS